MATGGGGGNEKTLFNCHQFLGLSFAMEAVSFVLQGGPDSNVTILCHPNKPVSNQMFQLIIG